MSGMPIHRNITLLKWFNFFLNFEAYSPIAIIYFTQVTGSFALGLSVYSFISISAVIFEVPTGIFSDMIGRKKTMFLGACARTCGLLFYAIGGSFLILVIGSVFSGLAEAFFSGNNDALLYDTLAEKKQQSQYAQWLGKVHAMFQVGLAIAAFIGGFIAEISFALVLWISVIPQVINVFLTLFIHEPRHYKKVSANIFSHLKEAIAHFKNNWKLRTLSITSIMSFGIGETLHQFVPAFYALVLPSWALGIPRTLSHIFGAASFHFAGAIIKKFGAVRVMLFNTFINRIIGFIAYGFPTIFSPFIVASGSLTFGIFWVSENALMHKEFTDHQRATMASLNRLFANIFFAIFAFLFGLLADYLGPARSLLVGEILLLPLAFFYWQLYKNHHD